MENKYQHSDIDQRGIASHALTILSVIFALIFLAGCSSSGERSSTAAAKSSTHKYSRSKASTHKVVKGDTLYQIAWKAGVDYKTLASWNGLKPPYTIYPGKVLRLKPPGSSAKHKKPAASAKKVTPKSQPKLTSTKTSKTKPKSKDSSTKGAVNSLHWRWPTEGRLLSTFKAGDSARTGIKIVGKKGQKIHAAESGKIVYVGGGLIGYGQLIIIKHNNKFLSAYGHNSRLLVKEGQAVKKGKHIADMGSANSGKAMLHFEIRQNGKPTDPMRLLPKK